MLAEKEQYEFIQMGGENQYNAGYSLNNIVKENTDSLKDLYIPLGLVVYPTPLVGGGKEFAREVRKKSMCQRIDTITDEMFDQLFQNVTKPVKKSNTTRRRRPRTA